MTFSNRVPPHAEINPLSRAIASLHAAGARIIDLTESNPTTVGLDYPAGWLDVLGAEHVLRYAPQPLGLALAREAVAGDYARRGARGRSRTGRSVSELERGVQLAVQTALRPG